MVYGFSDFIHAHLCFWANRIESNRSQSDLQGFPSLCCGWILIGSDWERQGGTLSTALHWNAMGQKTLLIYSFDRGGTRVATQKGLSNHDLYHPLSNRNVKKGLSHILLFDTKYEYCWKLRRYALTHCRFPPAKMWGLSITSIASCNYNLIILQERSIKWEGFGTARKTGRFHNILRVGMLGVGIIARPILWFHLLSDPMNERGHLDYSLALCQQTCITDTCQQTFFLAVLAVVLICSRDNLWGVHIRAAVLSTLFVIPKKREGRTVFIGVWGETALWDSTSVSL